MIRGRRNEFSVSLFPFLSVMGCTMGALAVIISAQNILSGSSVGIEIEVEGWAKGFEPVYVECDENGLIIHPKRTRVPLSQLRVDADSPFLKLLDELQLSMEKASPVTRSLVLLVRPGGIASYYRAEALALGDPWRVRVGKDAIPAGGTLTLRYPGSAGTPPTTGGGP